MLVKNMRNIMASVAGVAVATSAMGEGNSGVKADVYGELRMEATYNDDGLKKINDGVDPEATFRIGATPDGENLSNQNVRFGVRGSLNDRTTFKLQLNGAELAIPMQSAAAAHSQTGVDIASVTWKASDMISLSVGKDYVHQGGFSNADDLFTNIWGERIQDTAFNRFEKNVDLHYTPNEMHTISVQFVNDIHKTYDAGQAQYNDAYQRPTMILEYAGKFGNIEPLFQYGMYDWNKSSFMDIGARASFGQTALTFDYGTVKATQPVGDEDKSSSHDNITLRVEHDMGSMKPFFWYNSFKVTDKDVNGDEEKEVNSKVGSWDDNATQISLGTSFAMGDNFTPYVAYRMTSGDFNNDAGEKKSGSEGELGLGVLAHF